MTPTPALGPILAATDFSPWAQHAVDRAARLARETGAPLTVVHVLPGGRIQELRQWLGGGHAVEQQLLDQVRGQLQQLAQGLQATRHVPVQTVHSVGAVIDDILSEASALDASLLVLGARGASFMRRLVLGSTAERLLRRSARPLLVVRQTPHGPYRQALVAVDFSPWSAHAIALARRVAPHARLHLFTAYQVPFEEKLQFAGVDSATIARYRRQAQSDASQRLQALAAGAGLAPGSWAPCVVEGDASLKLIEHEQVLDCDLTVLGKHGQSAAEDLLLGSVSKHVLAEGSADVLVSTAHTP